LSISIQGFIKYQKKFKEDERRFYEVNKDRFDELLEACKRSQGEYLGADHGKGSWATSYSNKFIKASLELYAIFKSSSIGDPVYMLSDIFKIHEIKSCRGSIMSIDKAEYLVKTYVETDRN
jgi:hypothetical protein